MKKKNIELAQEICNILVTEKEVEHLKEKTNKQTWKSPVEKLYSHIYLAPWCYYCTEVDENELFLSWFEWLPL